MAGYTRQSTFTDGDVITAAHSNDEFDQLLSAFNNSSGHKHDGTAAEGPVIGLIGDPGVATPLNKVVVDDGNNQVEFNIDVSGVSTEQFVVKDGVIEPTTNNDIDIGSSSLKFKDGYFAGDVVAANISSTAFNGDLIPDGDNTRDIGSTSAEWKDLYIDGVAYIDSIAMPTTTVTDILDEDTLSSDSATALATQQSIKAYVDAQVTAQDLDVAADTGTAAVDLDSQSFTVTGGTGIDTSATGQAVTIDIDSTVATLTGTQTLTNKTLTTPVISTISNTGTVTLPTSTDTLVGRATTDTLTNKTLTSAVLNGTISGTSIKDEDDMSSDSASHLATQQSIKAYVDSQITANNEIGELTDVTITSVTDNEVLAYDSTSSEFINQTAAEAGLATLTGTETLTNKTLTSAVLNTGVSGTAVLDEDNMASDSATQLATQQSIKAYVDSQVGGVSTDLVNDTTPQLGGNLDSNGSDILFADNDKAVFGTGSDLQIYHDASNSLINDNGTGSLKLQSGGTDRVVVDSSVTIQGLTYPSSDGTDGQFLKTNGSGGLSFDTVSDPNAISFAIALG
jgi:hypothetical protein